MTIYVCRLDSETFWTEAECHYHVDLHHPEWGHNVCVRGTPTPFQCAICKEQFETKELCEKHLVASHGKAGDLSNDWEFVVEKT